MTENMPKFQPMPKRFMVWDSLARRFYDMWAEEGGRKKIFSLWDLEWLLDRFSDSETVIVQSTNLFDKDGKEIFEGSIVEFTEEVDFNGDQEIRRGVVVSEDGIFKVKCLGRPFAYNVTDDLTNGNLVRAYCDVELLEYLLADALGMDPCLEVLGHILSNPELLEQTQDE